jgi:carbonic anhydrase
MTLLTPLHQDDKYIERLLPLDSLEKIPDYWRGTPIEQLVMAENFGHQINPSPTPQLLIAACIEFRYALPIPKMYAYVIRRASGRLIGSEFSVAYVLSRGVKYLAMIGHNDCGMTKVKESAPSMVQALVDQGWNKDVASEYISYQSARYMMSDELDGLEREFHRLRRLFRKVFIAPLFVCLSDTRLYLPKWYDEFMKHGVDKLPDHLQDEELLSVT